MNKESSFDIYGMKFEAKENLVLCKAQEHDNGNITMGFRVCKVNENLTDSEKVASFIADLLNNKAKER